MDERTFTDIFSLSALGYLSVFVVLAVMICVVLLMTRVFNAADRKRGLPEPPAAPTEDKPALANGSCGDVKLYGVPDREAAMIMAVVADELKTPMNELRFISIRETEE